MNAQQIEELIERLRDRENIYARGEAIIALREQQAEIERLAACCRHRDQQLATLKEISNAKDAEIERLRGVPIERGGCVTDTTILICTVCDRPFDIEAEGGRAGDIGILPVAFCPTCSAGIMDFAEQELEARGWVLITQDGEYP